jgi:hypothetical protein
MISTFATVLFAALYAITGALAREPARVGLIDLMIARTDGLSIPGVAVRALSFASTGTEPAVRQKNVKSRRHGDDMLRAVATAFRAADPETPIEILAATPFRQDAGGNLVLVGDELELAYAWFAQNRVTLVGETFVGSDSPVQRAAIATASGRGLIILASAGNGPALNAVPPFPAAYPGVISISTTRLSAELLREVDRDSYVDFSVAPPLKSTLSYRRDPEAMTMLGSSAATATALGLAAALHVAWPVVTREDLVELMACVAAANGAVDGGRVWGRGALSVASVKSHLIAGRGLQSPCGAEA